MIIKANGRTIEAMQIAEGRGEINGESRPTIAISVKGGMSEEDVKALTCGVIDIDDGYNTYLGFTGLVDLELLLYKPNKPDLVLNHAAELQRELERVKAELSVYQAAQQSASTQGESTK